jgi:hypothetical protein
MGLTSKNGRIRAGARQNLYADGDFVSVAWRLRQEVSLRLFPLLLVLALTVLGTACAFQKSSSTVAPSSSSGGTSLTSLIGDWNSSEATGALGVTSCEDFEWHISGQGTSALSAEFSAICAGLGVSGTASGTVNGTEVPYQITGSASVPGGVSCPFTLSGVAHIEVDAIRVPYSGATCLGPLHGEQVLRRRTTTAPPPPPPPPQPPPQQAPTNPNHVAPGPLSVAHAQEVVYATANEFPGLQTPRGTDAESAAAGEELLRRIIWHLQLAGFQAGRQRNPSGAISGDKLTVVADGAWHAYDVWTLGGAGRPISVIFYEVFPPNPVADGGIPD